MSQLAYKHYQRALAKWPKDALRPDCQLQEVLAKRLEKQIAAPNGAFNEKLELKQVNALYSLLEGRYQTKYRTIGNMMEPRSNPTYYKDLLTELEEAPNRSWLGRVGKRLGGLIRFT